jgi:two-component system, NarL family, sensor histidine kinase UhpB
MRRFAVWFSQLSLLWRVFAINACMLVVATLVLLFAPVTIHAPIKLVEAIILVAALIVMVTANLLLLRTAFAPLEQLVEHMPTIDLLRPGQRFVEGGGPYVSKLVRAFNEMLDRLEYERRESGRRALAAQEAERARIARGLHDEVGQVLTGVLLQLDSLGEPASPERRADVDETKQAVRQALEEVRRIARELRPEMLDHLGLVSSLTELASRFSQLSGVSVEKSFGSDLPDLEPDVELAIYRIAQESMTNIARHSNASRAQIALQRNARGVVLSVVDNGRGFQSDPPVNGHGGLRGMQERAMHVGGVLTLTSHDRGGAEVRLEIPTGGE